ncbi:hypothetical protein ADEAN_000907900 [Angomonas deanei]|uniref:Dynein heavy chain n=1 Tax=Angomonas deanei TaxID=59799 RepID=A0A7G2CQX3_9TRYP|nr:hypothetical protein ADEAN_000907900 [Angomonas deanei]
MSENKGRKVRSSLGEVPEDILKDKSAKEKAGVTRGYLAKTRMEDKDLPGIRTLAEQRYVPPEKLPTAKRSRSKPSEASVALRAGAGTLSRTTTRGGDPSQPTLKARIPKSLKHLAKDDNFTTAKERGFNTSAPPSLSALPAAGTPLQQQEAALDPDTVERIGNAFSPLSNIRTSYQNGEMEKKIHVGTRELRVLEPPPPSTQKVFFDLEDFDSAVDDIHTPEEWVALGGEEGTPARSRSHNSVHEVTWTACHVIGYDKVGEKYEIRWPDGKTKWARRFNIIFDAEDPEKWAERVRNADRYRFQFETNLREMRYIESIPDTAVTPVDQDQLDRVLELVSKKFDVNSLHLVEQYTEQAERYYYIAAKKALHYYAMRDVEERLRLKQHQLPPPPPTAIPSLRHLRGTIFTPSPNYHQTRAYLMENLFQAHSALQDTIRAIHNLWFDYATRELCVSSFQETPLQLEYFTEAQEQHGAAVSEKLRGEWTSTVHSTIQNNLDSYFNFYEDDMERYSTSRMNRFISLVNVMMNTQLRSLVILSMENYQRFMETYRVEPLEDDEQLESLPEDDEDREFWKVREAKLEAIHQKELEAKQEEEAGKVIKRSKSVVNEEKEDEGASVPFVWRLGVHTNTIPYTKRALELTQKPNGFQPLFAVTLVERNGRVCFSPSLEEVQEQVMKAFDQCVTHSYQVHGMGDQLFPLLEMKPIFLDPINEGESAVQEAREAVQRILSDNMEAPLQLQQMYQTFEYILKGGCRGYCGVGPVGAHSAFAV